MEKKKKRNVSPLLTSHLVILKHANTALVVQSFVLTKEEEEEKCSGGTSYTE